MNKRAMGFGICVALLAALATHAQVPAAFNYQGRLLDGTNLVNGARNFVVDLYTAETGGSAVYTETNNNVVVVDGLYSFAVGDDAAGLAQALTNSTLYLGLTVGSQTLAPRERLMSAAYAILAAGVQNSAIRDAQIAAGANISPLKIAGTALTAGTSFNGDVSGQYNNLQLGINTVSSIELANNAVTDVKVAPGASIAPSKIAGTALTQSTVFAGDVSGGYGTLSINVDAVNAADIVANAVGASEILDNSIADIEISTTANIAGTKVRQGTTLARGTLQLDPASTGTLAIAAGHPYLNAYSSVNTLAATTPNSALNLVGVGSVYVSNQAPNTVQVGLDLSTLPGLSALKNVIWVGANGTSSGPGTIDKPYDTPQNGYNAAVINYPGQVATLLIAAGSYSGLNMTVGHVHVLGLNRPVLDSLTVSGPGNAALLQSKQRVQNLAVKGAATVAATASHVKIYNTVMNAGLVILGNDVEVQNCAVGGYTGSGPAAVVVGSGAETISQISIHHSSIRYSSPNGAGLLVKAKVQEFETLWCEVEAGSLNNIAIQDMEPGPISPLHLYAHNWIKGPSPLMQSWAVQDPNAGQNGPTIGFYNNTVLGNVGMAPLEAAHAQFYGNNMVYGRINNAGGGILGWMQAGAGTGADAANNTEHETAFPALPNSYRD